MSYPVKSLADVVDEHIEFALDTVKGNKTEAAKLLGVDRRTIYRHLAKKKRRKVRHEGTSQEAT